MRTRHKKRGISLAKGPVGLIGMGLLIYGITAVIFAGHSFTQHAPSGAVHGKLWIGLEVNGWSSVLFIAAGLLLLLAAPLHWAAKGMSLIVGVALGAAALVSLAKGRGVLGIFAANHLTELVWGATGALLILLSLLPRVGGKTKQRYDQARAERAVKHEPLTTVESEPALAPTIPVNRESLSTSGAPTNPRVTPASGNIAESYVPAAASAGRNGTSTVREDTAGGNEQSDATSAAPAAASERPMRTTVLAVQESISSERSQPDE